MTPHPPTPSFSIRRVLIAVGLCTGLVALLLSQARNLNEYRLCFKQDGGGRHAEVWRPKQGGAAGGRLFADLLAVKA